MRYYILLLFLLLGGSAIAQNKHDLRLGISLDRAYSLNYNYLQREDKSWMLSLSFLQNDRIAFVPDSIGSDINFTESFLKIRAGRTHYPKGHASNGWEWGYYGYALLKLNDSEEFIEQYEEVLNFTPEYKTWGGGVGAIVGYRFILKD
ncbi:MAG: hypothetical protein AAGI23_09185 [Bacteroidota bacterium]